MILGGNLSIQREKNIFVQAEEADANCFQFFLSGLKDWPTVTIQEEFIKNFQLNRLKYAGKYEKNIFVHGNLLINIASTDRGVYQRSVKVFLTEMGICNQLGVDYYVLHPGSSKKKMSRPKTIANVAATINEVLDATLNTTILIEIMAGQGDQIGVTFEELREIRDKVVSKNRLGICLDTQHMWASGIDIGDWTRVREEFDECLGLDTLKLIHLNDSKSAYGSRIDAHEKIGKGTMPISVFRNIINDPLLKEIPMILETSHSEDPLNVESMKNEFRMIRNELPDVSQPNGCQLLLESAELARHSFYANNCSGCKASPTENKKRSHEDIPRECLATESTNTTTDTYEVREHIENLAGKTTNTAEGAILMWDKLNSMQLFKGQKFGRLYTKAHYTKERAMERLGNRMKNRWKLIYKEKPSYTVDQGAHDRFINTLDDTARGSAKTNSGIPEELRMEYYTPDIVIESINKLWPKGVDLDPASSMTANQKINAKRIFTKADGDYTFTSEWKAESLFLNPPFAQPVGTTFINKVMAEWRAGNIGEALLLLPATGGQWMNEAVQGADAIAIPNKRLHFWNACSRGLSPRYQTYLLYFGDKVDSFKLAFGEAFTSFTSGAEKDQESSLKMFALATNNQACPKTPCGYDFVDPEDDPLEDTPYWDTISARMKLKVQNTEAIAILDSGSCNTTISTSLWRRITERRKICLRRWRWGGIKVANDQEVHPIGWTNLTLSVGLSNVTLPVSVQDNLPVDMLVGTDWLRESGAVVDWEAENLTFKREGGTVKIQTTIRRSQMRNIKVRAAESIVIPPLTQMLCTFQAKQIGFKSDDLNYYIHPRESMAEKGVFAAPGYNNIVNDTVSIMIANLKNVPSRINQNAIVAELEPCPHIMSHQLLATEQTPKTDEGEPTQSTEEITNQVINLMDEMNINSESYNEEEFRAITKLITKHRKTFSNTPGLCHLIQHKIDTGDQEPIICQPYRVPYKLKPVVKEIIQDMLDKNLIRPSNSPWAFPVVMVPKPDGKWRMTVDYRKLNAIVPRDAFPLPRIDDHLTSLGDSKIFTVLDLVSGFWQIGVREEDKPKTAFICSEGLYEYERMPMGLSNSPATFQRLMQQVIPADARMFYALVYLDDIIIHSKTFMEHMTHLDDILTKVAAANLKIKPKKVSFAKNSVKYLGHLVTSEGVKPDPSRVEAIANWKCPENLKELRSFVQLVNYYRQYIRGFAKIASPLYDLMKKDNNFNMGEKETEAFQELRTALLSETILKRPDWSLPFVLQTDASIKGLGVVLAQRDKVGNEHVIGYASRSLSAEEKPWGTHEWEALALIWGAEYFRNYLYAQHFVVESDNLDLTWLRNSTKGGRLLRWGLRLSEFDFTIKHRKGSQNGNADALSRMPLGEERKHEPLNAKDRATGRFHEDIPGIAVGSTSCMRTTHELPSIDTSDHIKEWITAQEACPEIGCIKRVLTGELREGENITTLEGRQWVKLRKIARNYYIRPDGLIGSKCILSGGIRGPQAYETIAVPIQKRESILTALHTRAHIGINKSLRLIKERYYWGHLQKDVKAFIKGCHTCRSRKDPRPALYGKLKPYLHLNNRPWDTLTMDIFGAVPTCKDGYRYLLVMVDHLTKWPEAYPLRTTSASEIASVIINEFIPRHSVPRKVVSDNGSALIAESINLMWKLLGTNKVKSSISHPQTNTAAERFNRYLGDSIYAAVDNNQTNWPQQVATVLMAYRMSINPTTGESPYFLLHGTDPTLPEDIIFALEPPLNDKTNDSFLSNKFEAMRSIFRITKERLTRFAEKEKSTVDTQRKTPRDLRIGRKVMVFHEETHTQGESTKMHSRYSGPYRIIEEVLRDKTLKLWHPQTGNEWTVNVDRIRPFDPWESYNQGRAEDDTSFWEHWAKSADNAEVPTLEVANTATFSKEAAIQEEETLRRNALERYERISKINQDTQPDAEGAIAYARNWAGDWVPYNNDNANFEVIRILDRAKTEGSWNWLVQWKGDWLPTWEPLATFQEGRNTGVALTWRQFEDANPYPLGEKRPAISGVRNRKR